jgi:hypothetical protein
MWGYGHEPDDHCHGSDNYSEEPERRASGPDLLRGWAAEANSLTVVVELDSSVYL